MKTTEINLLDQAIDQLKRNTGFTIKINQFHRQYVDATGFIDTGANRIPIAIDIKKLVINSILPAIAHQFTRMTEHGLVVAHYINPLMAERLKDMGIWFIDTAGNAYINALPIYVYIKGNKPAEAQTSKAVNRAFTPIGLKIVYALLCRPELVNAPYREIAQTATAALGTVALVFKDLIQLGYIVDMGGQGRRLKNRQKLLERWLIAYPEQLRPKLETGRYRAPDPNWWQIAPLHNLQAYWGGDVAADKLTHYLKPATITIYVMAEWASKLKVAHRLRKDPSGDIEILNTFWDVEGEFNRTDVVHPILIYADLLASGDPRNLEVAQIIYEQELAEHFRED
ncbi:type IV toxin-antitoxin system AbiEi family antitoxin [Methylomonas sp. DH-1]|uniref:type IV toxin-antitoxin system AbiEi family antitoxin n=1 Tax=Methylomonas sp. (strain DH-1) TaxID=1727196 RepID=UPI0007C92148|nr:type IV toxin-antitoxin system AbiEi family antitoxin [Methylomonas sp. DH-1]ANE56908.1 hypothetical protein AYM39_18155 [Methylomonas sp. DH-1]